MATKPQASREAQDAPIPEYRQPPADPQQAKPLDPSKIPDPNADVREQENELNQRAPGLGTLEDQKNKGKLQ